MNSKTKHPVLKIIGVKVKPLNPITWKYEAKKIGHNRFKVRLKVCIENSWRLYSQDSSMEGPPSVFVSFDENDSIWFIDVPKEKGALVEELNKDQNVKIGYYVTELDIVQEVMTTKHPITLKGKLFYAPCTQKKCLQYKEAEFQIKLH